jgi:hypothetical protein
MLFKREIRMRMKMRKWPWGEKIWFDFGIIGFDGLDSSGWDYLLFMLFYY